MEAIAVSGSARQAEYPQNVAFNEANRSFRINKSIRKSENNEAKSIPGRTQFPSLGFSGILIYRQAM